MAGIPAKVIGRARILPEHRRHTPSITRGIWYDVIEPTDPALTSPLPDYVWIDLDGRPRYLPARWLEIESQEGSGGRATG